MTDELLTACRGTRYAVLGPDRGAPARLAISDVMTS
jgi:hypothetical protein